MLTILFQLAVKKTILNLSQKTSLCYSTRLWHRVFPALVSDQTLTDVTFSKTPAEGGAVLVNKVF